ncbi:uncharacterized protein LOC142635059 [Castanea sativa]|uniref:uncharacterized protein LOC142635059 n=1 Tax=Castanea sativa TaxID=21020 RepID=UPI003F654480
MRKLRMQSMPCGGAKYLRRSGGKKKDSGTNYEHQAGIGVVIRDSGGRIQGALLDKLVLPRTVEEVEALACKTAMRYALELGFEEVVFEGDSETITNAINSTSPCLSSFGNILDDVRSLALNFVSAIFVHIKRQGNAVADKFAKASKFSTCPHFWLNDILLVFHDQ